MTEKTITEDAVLSLFRDGKITISRGAELLGIPIQDFMKLLNQKDLTLDDLTPEEMREDLKTLQRLRKKYMKKAKAV